MTIICVVGAVLALTGCAQNPAANEAPPEVGLPAVTRLGGMGGRVVVANVDGQPGEEVVAGICETFCSPSPADLWILSP